MIRWLVADVPKRMDVFVREDPTRGTGSVMLTAFVRGTDFEARENADVKFTVVGPDGQTFELTGEPSDSVAGQFESSVAASQPGAWQVSVTRERFRRRCRGAIDRDDRLGQSAGSERNEVRSG